MATKIAKSKKIQYWGTGRRKKSIARVRVLPNGNGSITINGRDIDNYFNLDTLKYIVRQPLVLTDTQTKYDVAVNVHGGGFTGQAGAIRHGISRALVLAGEDKDKIKKAGFLTRDPRMKERKKYGISEDNLYDGLLWGIPVGIIGARVYYVLFYLDNFKRADGSFDFGSAIAFFARRTNKRLLSFSLGLSGGVMIYVSFVELSSPWSSWPCASPGARESVALSSSP